MKRLISLLLVLSMTLSVVPVVASAAPTGNEVSVELSNPFTDVNENDWFYDAVQYARINGFFNGITETIFEPDGTMSRAMFVTVLGRMAGMDTADYKGQAPFADVPANMYYAPYVAWAAKHGVTSGTGDDTFSPDDLINREQMATFFVRYFDVFDVNYETKENITSTPADINDISSWAKDSVKKLWKQGLLNGDGTGFKPADDATRAQTATIAQRTDEAVETWYKEPGVPSDRVRINPKTGLPYDAEEKEEEDKEEEEDKSIIYSSSGSSRYRVNFYDGNTLIDTIYTSKNKPLGKVPDVEKSSKLNAVLLGYYTDKEFTEPFYAEEPVTRNMNVYAKYEEMDTGEELNFTSFAQMDQDPDVTFEVVGSGDPKAAVTLEVKDGSDPVELSFKETSDGYIVSAVNGFNKGASYQLHLAEGWNFKDKPETIRTASFSIAMKEVDNLKMNDEIKYIEDTDDIDYTIGGQTHDVLTQSLITQDGGSFNYDGAFTEGELVCIYVGTHPEERKGDSDILDPAVYVKVRTASNGNVEFEPLSDEDQQQLYDVPDNFPIIVPELPTGQTGTVNINDLDEEVYAMIMGEGYNLANAKEAIGKGDFISLYVSKESLETEGNLYFGEITDYDAQTGEITYKKTTEQAIESSMDLYSDIDLEGSDLVTDEEKEELEEILLTQVQESDFAEEAAFMLADIVTKTDGFKNNKNIQDFIVKDADGNVLSDEQLELLNLGGSFELSDDIKLTVELVTKGEQLHFNKGVQLAIGIEAEFEVELPTEDKINIELSATFVQEVMIDPKVKGSIVKKKILGIPIPIGVKVGATIDVKSFTAFSFEAIVFTVAAEDENGWDSFKDLAEETIKDLGIEIPDELKEGVSTVKDLVNKAKELEELAQEAKNNYNQYIKYLEDAENIWSVIEENGLTTKKDWMAMEEAFGATSIASDMLEMLDMTTETGLSTEYYDSVEALMDRYCEMLEQESDWVKLVEQQMFMAEVNFCGLVVGIEVKFVVRADLSLAIGSNLEYEVGKRYEFWFKIGLFSPSSGSSTMDLLDERFAFQFYVMGRLGLKAGIQAEFYVGIGTGDFASVGIYAELGPYLKLYGFFVYEYTKYRPANTNNWTKNERMMGALFMEFGLYFIMGFEAEALKLFEYSCEFVDEEIPLLNAGKRKFYYQFDYAPEEGEMIIVKDSDGDSTNGVTMLLPEYVTYLKYLDLTTGFKGFEGLDYKNYNFTVSNPNFKFDTKTGEISVEVPDNLRYMECDLTATYKHGKLAFSTYDMSVTIPLVWTSLSTAELSEYYTAAVRVGNDADGYETVWTKRLLKNKEFKLPSVDEIKELINWNDYKYELGTGYGEQQLEGLTIIDNKTYDFNINYKTYSITVDDIQNPDGSTESRTYTARFGETFDFSNLKETGTVDYTNSIFTTFSELTTPDEIDLTKAIDSKMADALINGVTVKANYIDNSVKATFAFTGIDAEDITVIMRKGDTPSIREADAVVDDMGMAIVDIYPAIAPISASTTYQVICGELTGPEATITFEENGGLEVTDITKVVGSLIGALPKPEREGHSFGGWFTDEALTVGFDSKKMPEGGATLYAKWTPDEYTVTFHVNGGNELDSENKSKTVIYGEKYGTLPVPQKTGSGFVGWFTASTDGEEVTAESLVNITENQTLYAQWRLLKEIPRSSFDFGSAETYTYERNVTRDVTYSFKAEDTDDYSLNEFTLRFMRQGNSEYETGLPVNAGTYNITISRPADDIYAKFEQTYNGVLKINKAVRKPGTANVQFVKSGFTSMELKLQNGDGGIEDLDENAKLIFNVIDESGNKYSSVNTSRTVHDIVPTESTFDTSVTVIDQNYEDWTSELIDTNYTLAPAPTTSWADYADTSWYNEYDKEFTLTTAAQLAGLAKLSNSSKPRNSFSGKTIKIGANLDLSEHTWTPIGDGYNYAFSGSIDGQGYTISGLYHKQPGDYCGGLIGYLSGDESYTTTLKNLVLDNSYIHAYHWVGGFVGYAFRTTISNCTNYAYVRAEQMGKDDDYKSVVGGIVGYNDKGHLYNCVNYGTVFAKGRHAGGIIGLLGHGNIANNANFGSVTGSSRVGGIIGCSDVENNSRSIYVYNNYNVGKVRPRESSNEYIGAIVGRNLKDNGVVKYNYYLLDCAKGGNGKSRYALGTETGSVTDGKSSEGQIYYASSFETPDSKLKDSAYTYAGLNLITALNDWVGTESGDYNYIPEEWTAKGNNGYPLPAGSPTSSLRK